MRYDQGLIWSSSELLPSFRQSLQFWLFRVNVMAGDKSNHMCIKRCVGDKTKEDGVSGENTKERRVEVIG
jgi:hypothetical protein